MCARTSALVGLRVGRFRAGDVPSVRVRRNLPAILASDGLICSVHTCLRHRGVPLIRADDETAATRPQVGTHAWVARMPLVPMKGAWERTSLLSIAICARYQRTVGSIRRATNADVDRRSRVQSRPPTLAASLFVRVPWSGRYGLRITRSHAGRDRGPAGRALRSRVLDVQVGRGSGTARVPSGK